MKAILKVFPVAALCGSLLAQSPASRQSGPSSQSVETAKPEAIYKITTRNVIVDVVVTDSSGQPVTGLTRDDFEVKEDRRPQTIGFFEPHIGTHPQQLKPLAPLPPGVFSNYPIAPATDSVNVLLLDSLNTPLSEQPFIRQTVLQYLKTAEPGTRIAIFTLTDRLHFIQGFSADPAVLLAAVEGQKNNGRKKALPDKSSMLETHTEAAQREETINLLSGGASPASITSMQSFLDGQQDAQRYQTDLRERTTLDAMKQIARYLARIPGRKNLIWFSGSFPLGFIPTESGSDDLQATRIYSEDIHEATNLLSVGQVSVYPIGAGGMRTSPVFDASVSGNHFGQGPGVLLSDSSSFTSSEAAEHATMNDVAWETGGVATYNTNDLKAAMQRAINNGSNYYTLSYSPTNKSLDGRLRQIEVSLEGRKYKLSYRRSYFADSVDGKHGLDISPTDNTFQTAMAPGLPPASQIIFKVRASALDPQPAQLNAKLDPTLKARDVPVAQQPAPGKIMGDNAHLKGPVTRYVLDYAVNVRDLHFTTTPDGVRHGSIIVGAMAYDADGSVENSTTRTAHFDLTPESYADMLKSGMKTHVEMDFPRRGLNLRTGIFDVVSSNMGILDVPLEVEAAVAKP